MEVTAPAADAGAVNRPAWGPWVHSSRRRGPAGSPGSGHRNGMTCWRSLRDWNSAGGWQGNEVPLAELRAAGKLDLSRAVVDSSRLRTLKGDSCAAPEFRDGRRPWAANGRVNETTRRVAAATGLNRPHAERGVVRRVAPRGEPAGWGIGSWSTPVSPGASCPHPLPVVSSPGGSVQPVAAGANRTGDQLREHVPGFDGSGIATRSAGSRAIHQPPGTPPLARHDAIWASTRSSSGSRRPTVSVVQNASG